MIVEAGKRGCVREVMILAAALTIQDPRERPGDAGKQQLAAEKHARFRDENSDFTGFLNLWNYIQEKQQELSSTAFRRLCRERVHQLPARPRVAGPVRPAAPARPPAGHQPGQQAPGRPGGPSTRASTSACSPGLLSHIGILDERKREYAGARGSRFAIFPGSALFKKSPTFVMAAELVETSRLWARVAAKFDPLWAEQVAPDLVKRTYSEPHWSKKMGSVMAYEKVTLYGVPIIPSRRINYGKVDPELSRELFIRHALVEGDWKTHHKFFHRNRALLHEIEELEARMRRRDLLVDDETLFEFYDARIGKDVVSERHFDKWWKEARQQDPALLDFDQSLLISDDAEALDESAYPKTLLHKGFELPLSYEFNPVAPGSPPNPSDGVTAEVPVLFLNQLDDAAFRWLIPGPAGGAGHGPDQVAAQADPEELRAGPGRRAPGRGGAGGRLRSRRRRAGGLARTGPAPDPRPGHPAGFLELGRRSAAPPGQFPRGGPARQAAGRGQGPRRAAGTPCPGDAPRDRRIPGRHAGYDGAARPGRKRPGSAGRGAGTAPGALPSVTSPGFAEQSGLTEWSFGAVQRQVQGTVKGHTVTGYPALVDEGTSVALRLFQTSSEQEQAMRGGVIRLLALKVPPPDRYVLEHLNNTEKLTFSQNPHGSVSALIADCALAAIDKLTPAGLPWDEASFKALYEKVRAELIDTVFTVTAVVERILASTRRIEKQLKGTTSLALISALNDIRSQLEQLVFPGFVARTGYAQLSQLPRYLAAIEKRLEKLPTNVQRDAQHMAAVQSLEDDYDDAVSALLPGRRAGAELTQVRWMIEELRVSLFAVELGTAYSVSEKRIRAALNKALAPA